MISLFVVGVAFCCTLGNCKCCEFFVYNTYIHHRSVIAIAVCKHQVAFWIQKVNYVPHILKKMLVCTSIRHNQTINAYSPSTLPFYV